MKANCPQCGEELLGAVNSCWRCGADFTSDPGVGRAPPAQQSQPAPASQDSDADKPVGVEPERVESAELAEPGESAEPAELVDPSGAPEQLTAEAVETSAGEDEPAAAVVMIADGEPPVIRPGVVLPSRQPHVVADSARPILPQRQGKGRLLTMLGIAAIFAGVISCIYAFDSLWALPLAALGVAVGACGLMGRHRGPALAGILICCVALTVSGYRALIAAYTWYTGYDPFDQRPVEEVLFDEPEEEDELNDLEGW